jgi:ribonuclease HI
MLDPYAIHIYADGSCYRNPGGESGCAAIVEYPESLNWAHEVIVDFSCAESSINRMELMACIKALEWVRQKQPWPNVTRVQIVTDATYITNNCSYRAQAWKKAGWRNRYGKPIANDDLWKSFLAVQRKTGIRVDFVWQPGKTTVHGKFVDKTAKAAARRGGPNLDRTYRPGSVCRSMIPGVVAEPYPATGQIDVIRPYAKKLMFKGENRISFDIFVEATQTYRAKAYAFATPELAFDLHRWHGYRVRFGDTPLYPRIVEFLEEVALP